jgi:hypothetical protein
LNGTTPTAGAAIDGVLENLATTGYLVFNTRTASSLTEKMRLDTRGNLGLGVTPSAWADGKAFEIGALGNAVWSGSGYIDLMRNVAYTSGAYRYSANGTASRFEIDSQSFAFYQASSGTAGNAISFTQAMTLNASGNLGIGTTTIGSRLQVNGNAAIGYSASTAAPTNGLVVSGNVGINTTSVSNTLEVNGTARLQGSASGSGLFINNQAAGGTAQNYIDFTAGATNIVRFSRGNAAAGLEPNGLNIDNFAGFKVRLNQLGGSGGNFTIDGGGLFVGNGETAASPSTGIISGSGGSGTNVAGAEFRIRGGASTGNAAGGPITFYTSAAGSAGTSTNAATERMRITSGGDVAIGTTTASAKLHVNGDIRTSAPSGGTAANWKLGSKVASSVVFDDNDYLEVEVGGVAYKVALVTLA